jgi:hypothetical protein
MSGPGERKKEREREREREREWTQHLNILFIYLSSFRVGLYFNDTRFRRPHHINLATNFVLRIWRHLLTHQLER